MFACLVFWVVMIALIDAESVISALPSLGDIWISAPIGYPMGLPITGNTFRYCAGFGLCYSVRMFDLDLDTDTRALLAFLLTLLTPAILFGIHKFFRWRNPTNADRLWREYDPFLPVVRLTNGRLSELHGKVYRRWTGTRWEYRQDAETDEEYKERI